MSLDIEWLEDFVLVAEKKSFNRAAPLRGVTQSSLSRRVQKLEAWLGVTLFDPETDRRALTAHGRAFLPIARELLTQCRGAREQMRGMLVEE